MSEIKPWREYIGKPEAYMIMCDVLDVLCEKEAIKKAVYERLKQVPDEDMISRCELFNKLAVIPAPPEANEYKTEVYKVINGM